ncbi:lysophospholipase L1-like esterase [Ureibacillus xyleni]|uniref:Lysophospholipase L1-like esterase n=1 Tax=Ureibacillus xyleni TaxID=614648 RepID=A0A285T8L2_9BACL|nr:GDSL-type esterase/lipase family protein [Ureibacillus xyleni]SOC15877.1 lysophospholipase L1-like esterase [Ureibacillus xyleni]
MRLLTIVLLSCCFLSGCVTVVEPIEINELQSLTTKEHESQVRMPKESEIKQNETTLQSQTNDETLQTIEQYFLNDSPIIEEVNYDKTKIYYLALGDSLTRGVGDEEQKNGYTERLAEKIEEWTLNAEVVLDNRGKRGRRSDQLLSLIKKGHYNTELENSELITITIGGNDIMKIVKKDLFDLKREAFDKELVEFESRYNEIIQEIRLRNPDVPIILIGLYNPFSVITEEITEFEAIISEWNGVIEELSEKHDNACFVDVEDLFDANANLVYHTDFFHPNGYGYTIMTERIMSIMKSCSIEEDSKGLILFSNNS